MKYQLKTIINCFYLAMAEALTTFVHWSCQLNDALWGCMALRCLRSYTDVQARDPLSQGYRNGAIRFALSCSICCVAFRAVSLQWPAHRKHVISDIGYEQLFCGLFPLDLEGYQVEGLTLSAFLLTLISAYVSSTQWSSLACWHFARQRKVALQTSDKLSLEGLSTVITDLVLLYRHIVLWELVTAQKGFIQNERLLQWIFTTLTEML